MRERMWIEAKALAGLAESYARLGERAAGSGVTPDTMDLKLLYDVVTDSGDLIARRLGLWDDRKDDPHRALKESFWSRRAEVENAATERYYALLRRMYDAEGRLKELGEYPPPSREDLGTD